MQANGKLVIFCDILGNDFIINCIWPITTLCRRQNVMLTIFTMLFPCKVERAWDIQETEGTLIVYLLQSVMTHCENLLIRGCNRVWKYHVT